MKTNIAPPIQPNANKPRKKPAILFAVAVTAIILFSGSVLLFYKKKPAPPVQTINKSVQSTQSKPDVVVTETVNPPVPEKKAVKTVAERSKETAPKEVFNPTKYLSKTIKTHRNIVGQTVIEGSIVNTSSTMVFKDMVLDVSYLSKTGAIISTQRLVVYEVIRPGKKIPFKFKTKPPMGTKSSSAELVTAVAVK
ncbi:MAG: hypothetical protein WCF67_11935 [Chitinophagaceae bacterium]